MVSGTSTAYNAKAYQVTGADWTSASLQWSNKPAATVLLAENISHNNKTKYQFSCLAAVQHWYNGDTTGQHENYGIMLCYNDTTIADYNSVYSADYADATLRPSITISYDPLRISVQEGLSIALTPPTTGVTWTSSNTAVATVTSAGCLTGIKAGKATVSAIVEGAVVKEYAVYVTIPEGVYYIHDGGGYYLATNGGIADGTNAVLKAKAISGRAQLNQLWRIDHLINGYYSIRPLYKLDMGLTSENGDAGPVEITTIGTMDSWTCVPGGNRWTITFDSNGYVFYCAGTSYMTMYRPHLYSGGGVMTAPSATAASENKWFFENVPSVTNQVLLMDAATGASVSGNTFYINRGETVTLEELGIVASFVCGHSLDQSISWYSQNSANVSIDSTTGTMTASLPDRSSTIYAKHIHNGVEYSNTFIIVVNKQMTQFIDKMGDLYDVAYAYVGEKQTEAFEMMFNFIRGQKYYDDWWPGIAGDWNTVFVDYVRTTYPSLYSYFICVSEDNSSEGILIKVSDTCSNGYIDVLHLAATLNRLFYTGETYYNGINTLDLFDEEVNALSGWAGDCQSLIMQYFENHTDDTLDELYVNFYPMIGNESYKFGYPDIITDLDACNLSTILWGQSITTGEQLESILYSYYYGTEGNVAAKRFTTWIGSYTKDDLWYKFRDYCNDYSTIPTQKWPMLKAFDITDEQQKEFSQAFATYFWAQKVKE